jgi:hypothetical protein
MDVLHPYDSAIASSNDFDTPKGHESMFNAKEDGGGSVTI